MIACTSRLGPNLNADAKAKRFTPDSAALTVDAVRRNEADGRNFAKVRSDNGPGIEPLPDTMVRLKFRPGAHAIEFELEGKREAAIRERALKAPLVADVTVR